MLKSICDRVDQNTWVIFFTDALSILQAYNNGQLPDLEQAISNMKCLQKVLQWEPSHCRVKGNKETDKMAKNGSQIEPLDNQVSRGESRTIIKALSIPERTRDSHHNIQMQDQVAILRLRSGHNRLNSYYVQSYEEGALPSMSMWGGKLGHNPCPSGLCPAWKPEEKHLALGDPSAGQAVRSSGTAHADSTISVLFRSLSVAALVLYLIFTFSHFNCIM